MLTLYTVLLLLSIAQSHPSDCSYTDNKYGVKFNYYGLKLSAGGQLNYYTVHDATPDNTNDDYTYTYQFNLCAPVLDFPSATDESNGLNICLNPPHTSPTTYYTYCESQYINTSTTPNKCTQENKETINGKAYAYQYKNSQQCYPLSAHLVDPKEPPYEVSLYDPIDPTQGLTIQYKNGAWSDECGSNRELRIHLKCEDYASSVPKQTDVTELAPKSCKYELTVKSIHGCPSGCPAYANSLCASQGLCGYDFSTNNSHCFCFWGFSGSSCEQANPGMEAWKPARPAPDKNAGDYIQTIPTTMSLTNPFNGVVSSKLVNTTYDLSDAHNPNTIYMINDTTQADVGTKTDYRFYFNIGGTINSAKLPPACHKVVMPCKYQNYTRCMKDYLKNISVSDPAEIGFAFRYTNSTNSVDIDGDECILLGTTMMEWDRYDPDDNAAHGVKITYKNGSFMPLISQSDPLKIINCEFKLNLICPNTRVEYFEPTDDFVVDQSEVIDVGGTGGCSYEATFETAFACPYNCITENKKDKGFSVCSGKGMCIADPSAGFTRCICDNMYYSSDCSKEFHPSTSPTSPKEHSDAGYNITIVIISMLVIGFVIAVVYLWKRNKTLEKYAVPILDEHDLQEPTVPEYPSDDSDSDQHFKNRPKVGGSVNQEMVTMKISSKNDKKKETFKNKLFGKKKKQKKWKKQGKNKYQAQNLDISDDSDSDDQNGPSAYLAANQDDSESD